MKDLILFVLRGTLLGMIALHGAVLLIAPPISKKENAQIIKLLRNGQFNYLKTTGTMIILKDGRYISNNRHLFIRGSVEDIGYMYWFNSCRKVIDSVMDAWPHRDKELLPDCNDCK